MESKLADKVGKVAIPIRPSSGVKHVRGRMNKRSRLRSSPQGWPPIPPGSTQPPGSWFHNEAGISSQDDDVLVLVPNWLHPDRATPRIYHFMSMDEPSALIMIWVLPTHGRNISVTEERTLL